MYKKRDKRKHHQDHFILWTTLVPIMRQVLEYCVLIISRNGDQAISAYADHARRISKDFNTIISLYTVISSELKRLLQFHSFNQSKWEYLRLQKGLFYSCMWEKI